MFKESIFSLNKDSFENLALKIFQFQAQKNNVYKKYLAYIGIKPEDISKVKDIPFLPISFFKSHKVLSNKYLGNETIFMSSGTGGMPSRHYVSDIDLYEKSFLAGFNKFFGRPSEYVILALLPNYLEKGNSSLVYMVNKLIEKTNSELSGFFLYDFDKLDQSIKLATQQNKKILLIGVSFALVDFFEKYNYNLKNLSVIETGGMKGRKKEILRSELHSIIKKSTNNAKVYSEYGMTELLSQAYLTNGNRFYPSDTMRVYIRELYDPFNLLPNGKTGGINVVDLANFNSCSFIETQDLGVKYDDGSFEVLGRYDNSEIRGCNLMVV